MARIHLIDDDPSMLDLVRLVLEVSGHEVFAFLRAEDSLEALGHDRPDAVVLDLMLTGMDGFEYLAAIRANPESARVPVLVCSALREASCRTRAFKHGADDFVVKPVEPEELVARVDRLVERTTAAFLEGTVEGYSMVELLQSLEQARRSGIVRWTGDQGQGWIALIDGVVVGARSGRLAGLEGALTLLELKTARFVMEPDAKAPEAAIRRFSVTDLLMQRSWLEDETSRRLGLLRAASKGLEVGDSPAALDSDLEKRLFARVAALPGVTLLELIEQQIASPQRTRYTVAVLMEKNVLVASTAGGDSLR